MEVSTGHNLDSNTKHGVFVFPRGKTMVSVSSTAILIVIDKLGNNNNNNNDQTSGFASDQTWCDHPFESMIIPRVVREENFAVGTCWNWAERVIGSCAAPGDFKTGAEKPRPRDSCGLSSGFGCSECWAGCNCCASLRYLCVSYIKLIGTRVTNLIA